MRIHLTQDSVLSIISNCLKAADYYAARGGTLIFGQPKQMKLPICIANTAQRFMPNIRHGFNREAAVFGLPEWQPHDQVCPRGFSASSRSGTPMTPKTTTPDVDVSRRQEEIDTHSPHSPSAPSRSGTMAKSAKSTVKPLIILIAASVMAWAAAIAIHGF